MIITRGYGSSYAGGGVAYELPMSCLVTGRRIEGRLSPLEVSAKSASRSVSATAGNRKITGVINRVKIEGEVEH